MEQINGLDLFSGIGGITLALSEWVRPIAYCEIEDYAQRVLLSRMLTGDLPTAPIWDDVKTLDGSKLPKVDIIYGGFPCQDISIAGLRKGLEGERSGLFFQICRLVKECRPKFIFLENVPNIRTKGLDTVIRQLTEMGYDLQWCMLSASDVGALHKRERWFCLASMVNPNSQSEQGLSGGKETELIRSGDSDKLIGRYDWQKNEPGVGRVVDGLPKGVDSRLKSLGNSVVPSQVRKAFTILMGI